MPASLDDILSAQKNGVVAINNVAKSTQRNYGTQTSSTVTTPTLVVSGSGYLVNFSILVAGSTVGTISNSATVALVAANNALCATPATVGIYPAGQVFSNGLVITPGTGQSINVTYSMG